VIAHNSILIEQRKCYHIEIAGELMPIDRPIRFVFHAKVIKVRNNFFDMIIKKTPGGPYNNAFGLGRVPPTFAIFLLNT